MREHLQHVGCHLVAVMCLLGALVCSLIQIMMSRKVVEGDGWRQESMCGARDGWGGGVWSVEPRVRGWGDGGGVDRH